TAACNHLMLVFDMGYDRDNLSSLLQVADVQLVPGCGIGRADHQEAFVFSQVRSDVTPGRLVSAEYEEVIRLWGAQPVVIQVVPVGHGRQRAAFGGFVVAAVIKAL